MTRKEKIISEAKKYYLGNMRCYDAFLHGVEFADEHPKNIWHDVGEQPDEYSNIVIVDNNKRFLEMNYCSAEYDCYGLLGWGACHLHYNIKYWAYVDDLLPKTK